jgi:HD-like signal output (HDOD) protein
VTNYLNLGPLTIKANQSQSKPIKANQSQSKPIMSSKPELLDDEALDALVQSIKIPPRPSLLVDVQQEMANDDPDPRKIAQLVSKDVAMSASLLKSANSAFFALPRKADTVEQAAELLGLTQCCSLLLGLIMRKAMHGDGVALAGFWDTATKRAFAMARLARTLRACRPDTAHTFGLFCDIGIPMLLDRLPNYNASLIEAQSDLERSITTIEDLHHGTNHATMSAIMSSSWGLSPDVTQAIRYHHQYEVMGERRTTKTVSALVAMCVLAERAIQSYRGTSKTAEWNLGGDAACDVLGLSPGDVDDCCDGLHQMFDAEH